MNEGGPPPALPCDTAVTAMSRIPMADSKPLTPEVENPVQFTKKDFEQTLTENLDRLREEIHQFQAKSATLTEAAKAQWSRTMADLEAKQKVAREKLREVASSTGEAWEHVRDGARNAWNELEQAVKNATKNL